MAALVPEAFVENDRGSDLLIAGLAMYLTPEIELNESNRNGECIQLFDDGSNDENFHVGQLPLHISAQLCL